MRYRESTKLEVRVCEGYRCDSTFRVNRGSGQKYCCRFCFFSVLSPKMRRRASIHSNFSAYMQRTGQL